MMELPLAQRLFGGTNGAAPVRVVRAAGRTVPRPYESCGPRDEAQFVIVEPRFVPGG